MNRTEVDGVPVLWLEAPGPLSASLLFGVGARHESFRTVGVTHLVEHLVMSTLPKSHLDSNAQVGLDATTFMATGRPEAVVDFLHRVCAALRDLPLDRLATEAGVLAAEGGSSEHPAMCMALNERFGLTGAGLLGTDGPGVKQVTAEAVAEHVRRWFVRENAVLALTGPLPEGLRLHLAELGSTPGSHRATTRMVPDGAGVDGAGVDGAGVDGAGVDGAGVDGAGVEGAGAPASSRLTEALPCRLGCDAPHPSLSLQVRGADASAWSCIARILADRVTDELRHGKGLVYEVDFSLAWLDPGVAILALWTDGQEESVGAVAEGLWGAVRAMAADGPTEAELDHDRAGLAEFLADPRGIPQRLETAAWQLLTDQRVPDADAMRREHDDLTAARLRDLVGAALPTALMLLPESVDADLPGLPGRDDELASSDDPEVSGTTFGRRLVSLAPRDLRVIAGEDGISMRAVGQTMAVRWDDVVGMGVHHDERELVAGDGRSLSVSPQHLRGGAMLVALIDQRLPARLRFDYDPAQED